MTSRPSPRALLLVIALASACGAKTAVISTVRADVAGLETTDQALAGALAALRLRPTGDNYRRVADELMRLNVLDQAHEFLTVAIRLNHKDARAYDARARIWRQWRLTDQALDDVKRALRLAPAVAEFHNTAGTVFFARGATGEAVREFTRALALDPTAAYAANNLCYLAFLDGDKATAEANCLRALDLSPALEAARQNLALVYAATHIELAEQQLMAGGDEPRGRYNLGILYLARREYAQAAAAFDAACAAQPAVLDACERARRARVLMKAR